MEFGSELVSGAKSSGKDSLRYQAASGSAPSGAFLIALLGLLFAASCGYQIVALFLALRFGRGCRGTAPSSDLRFCQVKPLYQHHQGTLDAIESFLCQDGVASYDTYLCSADSGPSQWLERHPQVTWLRLHPDQSRNGKAATLALAQPYWSGDVFVVSDADMWAPRDYLAKVLAEFSDPEVGVVTCVYSSTAPRVGDWGHLFESLCISDFASSVLVARQTEGLSFAMGSTMAVRREALDQIGGFHALEPYLADDYQLGNRAHKAGWKVSLAKVVLATDPPRGRLAEALAHQYRWLVTSRVSRPGGHLAFIVTQGLLWASLMLLFRPALGCSMLVSWSLLRWLCGFWAQRDLAMGGVRRSAWQVLFLPWKDALYLALWFASLRGRTVRWGERDLTIDRSGQIL